MLLQRGFLWVTTFSFTPLAIAQDNCTHSTWNLSYQVYFYPPPPFKGWHSYLSCKLVKGEYVSTNRKNISLFSHKLLKYFLSIKLLKAKQETSPKLWISNIWNYHMEYVSGSPTCQNWEYIPREQRTYLESWWKTSHSEAWCSTVLQLALGRTGIVDLANLLPVQGPHLTNTAWLPDSLLPSALAAHILHFGHCSKNPMALR